MFWKIISNFCQTRNLKTKFFLFIHSFNFKYSLKIIKSILETQLKILKIYFKFFVGIYCKVKFTFKLLCFRYWQNNFLLAISNNFTVCPFLISAVLEPILSHAEKSCIALYYKQFSTHMKIKINYLILVLLTRVFGSSGLKELVWIL